MSTFDDAFEKAMAAVKQKTSPTAAEFLDYIATNKKIYYQAPLDYRPHVAWIDGPVKRYKRDPKRFSVRIQAGDMKFRIDNDHLNRIKLP